MNRLTWLLIGVLLSYTSLAQAAFSIAGTRVIYDEAEGEATVHMQRTSGTAPVLLQVWLDDGSPNSKPGAQRVPFILTPAVSRVDPDRAQVIRIFRVDDDLPTDRESLLFFNALEVPAAPIPSQQTQGNHLRIAAQARMKFFYRPKSLQPAMEDAADALQFTLLPSGDATLRLHIDNPTPYHITVPRLSLHASPDAPKLAHLVETAISPMVSPFGHLVVALEPSQANSAAPQRASLPASAQVRYTIINDMGGLNDKTAVLKNAS